VYKYIAYLLLLVTTFVGGYATCANKLHHDDAKAQLAREVAFDQKLAGALLAQKAVYNKQMAQTVARQAVRVTQAADVQAAIQEVRLAPSNNACLSSPAIVAALDWVRDTQALSTGDPLTLLPRGLVPLP